MIRKSEAGNPRVIKSAIFYSLVIGVLIMVKLPRKRNNEYGKSLSNLRQGDIYVLPFMQRASGDVENW